MKFNTLISTPRKKIVVFGMASMVSMLASQETVDDATETSATEKAEATKAPELKASDSPNVGKLPEGVGLPTSILPSEDGSLPADFPLEATVPDVGTPKKSDIITKRADPTNPYVFTNLNLRALTLIPDGRRLLTEDETRAENFAHGSGISFKHLLAKNVPVPEPEELEQLLRVYIGKPLTFQELEDIVKLTQKHYVENDYPLIHVFIPNQEVSDKVKIAVKVGRVTHASVSAPEKEAGEGFWDSWKAWYSESYDLDDLAEKVNDKIQASTDLQPTQLTPILAEANRSPWARLNRVQQHPFLNVSGKLKPRKAGTDPNSKQFILGETEVELVATQERPLKFFVGYDNSLTELLGEDRYYLGSVWYDAFGLGLDHQLAIQAFSASDSNALMGIAGTYQIPWQNVGQHTELSAAYVESEATVSTAGIPTDIGGTSFIFGARHFFELPPLVDGGEIVPGTLGFDPTSLDRPLWSKGKKARQSFGIFHEVGIGIDYKQTDNTLEFGGINVSDDSADLSHLVLAYNARQTDENGETNLTFENFFGLGGDDDDFDRLRTGSEAGYYYARLKLEREQDLPAGMLLKGRLLAQYSPDNLLQSEQLGFGGYNSIRGYAERAYRADSGIQLSAEIYSPPLHPLAHFWGSKGLEDELRFLAFIDYGTGDSSEEVVSTDVSQSMMSVGLGFRYNVGDDFSMRFDWGFPLEDLDNPPFPEDVNDPRAHLGVVWTF